MFIFIGNRINKYNKIYKALSFLFPRQRAEIFCGSPNTPYLCKGNDEVFLQTPRIMPVIMI